MFDRLKNKVFSGLERFKDRVGNAAEKAMEAVNDVTEWGKETASDATEWIKDSTCDAAERVKDSACDVKEMGAKVYSAYTGKDKFDQANRLYEELASRQKATENNHCEFIRRITEEIEREVESINKYKQLLGTEHFQRFVTIARKISCWEIVLQDMPERFHYTKIQSEQIKGRDSLFLIDFDKNPIRNHLEAFLTLGFSTRKRATETLYMVQEQEKVLDCEITKIKAEEARLEVVLESLRNVATYFKDLTKIYNDILNELDYSINLVANAGYLINPLFNVNGKIDCYLFPHKHLLCLMASEKMTRILHKMTTLHYLSQDCNIIDDDKRTMTAQAQIANTIASDIGYELSLAA